MVDPVSGWMFRPYRTPTWDFVSATFLPKYLLTSATMSEASLGRMAGKICHLCHGKCFGNPFAENMGIARPDILTFARPPVKNNVFQELLVIKKLLYR